MDLYYLFYASGTTALPRKTSILQFIMCGGGIVKRFILFVVATTLFLRLATENGLVASKKMLLVI
jgi:hypothetical protein